MSPKSSLIPRKANDDDGSDQNTTSITTNANDIIFIPFHIVQQILRNLDAQTLFKCAFVCRDWNSFITYPDFTSHDSRSPTFDSKSQVLLSDEVLDGRQHSFSLHWDNDQFDLIHTVDTPPIFDGFKGRVVGTSNGLVCLSNLFQQKFALWNPTVRKYVIHPTPFFACGGKIRETNSSVAFGFDDRSNDLKVIYLEKNRGYNPVMAWVFSYITWSWECLICHIACPLCQVESSRDHMLFMNGTIHWIAWHSERLYHFILTLSTASEVFGEIFLPVSIMGSYGSNTLVQMGDSLAVVHKKRKTYDLVGCWSVWVMKQYGDHDSWTNVINMREEDYVYSVHDKSLIPKNLLAIKNQDMILETRGGQIVRYNPTTTTMKVLRQWQPLISDGAYVLVHDYEGSLNLLEKEGCNVKSY